jgi:hypothetical protein
MRYEKARERSPELSAFAHSKEVEDENDWGKAATKVLGAKLEDVLMMIVAGQNAESIQEYFLLCGDSV